MFTQVPPFATVVSFYCQKILPAVYDDSLSYYESVCRLVKVLNEHVEDYNQLVDVVAEHSTAIEELQQALDDFVAHGFDDYYKAQVQLWIDEHLSTVLEDIFTRSVYFGLTLDGHFVAYIPDTWDDIAFDTGYNYGTEEYGRLILMWDVDSPHDVQQP